MSWKPRSILARIAAEVIADPLARNREIASLVGVVCDDAFCARVARVRKAVGIPPRKAGGTLDDLSIFGRIRSAIKSNPSSTNRQLAAALGVEYSRRFASQSYQMRRALGIPSPRRLRGIP